MKHEENVTYEFIPDEDDNWHIRILEGMYNETVIAYGAIGFNVETEDTMTFNFNVVSSPDPDLTSEDEDLQEVAGDILQEIIRSSIEKDDGTISLREVKK